jgi:hypothetical protein
VPWNIQTTVTIRITETTIVVIKPALPKPQKLVGLAAKAREPGGTELEKISILPNLIPLRVSPSSFDKLRTGS